MDCWNLRLRWKSVSFGFAENQKERVNATNRRFSRIVKLRVIVTALLQLLHPFRSTCTQIIEPAKHDRFGRANFGAGWDESALLSIVAKRAFECAACIRQR